MSHVNFWQELKVKKEKELLITILTVCWDEKNEQEIGEFFRSSRDASSVQIQVLLMIFHFIFGFNSPWLSTTLDFYL